MVHTRIYEKKLRKKANSSNFEGAILRNNRLGFRCRRFLVDVPRVYHRRIILGFVGDSCRDSSGINSVTR